MALLERLPEALGFNPTLVRLRHETVRPHRPHPTVFQSHAGSIEAAMSFTGWVSVSPSFNPTLVRLRHNPSYVTQRHWKEFQSHAGSIEASGVGQT